MAKHALIHLWGEVLLPYSDALAVAAILQNANKVEGYGSTRKLMPLNMEIKSIDDVAVQALEEAPIYGVSPDLLEEKLRAAKQKPTRLLKTHPELLNSTDEPEPEPDSNEPDPF